MRHAGRRGRVSISGPGSPAGSPNSVAALTSWSLDRTTDKIDVTGFGDNNKQYVQGLPDVKGALAGNWEDADTQLWAAANSETPVFLELYPDVVNSPGSYFSGPAYVDFSINCDSAGAVKISGNWVAAGDWTGTGI